MESYGEILRNERELKGLFISDIARDTALPKNYLEALEEERVDDFPGETYFIGALDNYCEYLGIDKNEIRALYHAKKIQEAPVPVELLQKSKPKYLIPLIASVSAAIIIGLGIYLYFVVFNVPQKIAQSAEKSKNQKKNQQYLFTGKPETKRFYKGDQILVPSKDGKGNIVLIVSRTLGKFQIETPQGRETVDLSEERALDIDGDGGEDLIVYLSDIDDKKESAGAEIRLLAKNESGISIAMVEASEESVDSIPIASSLRNNATRTVLHEDTRPYPFTFNVTFRAPCIFRYKIDNQTYIERYFKSGESGIAASAQNSVRFWTSNNNAMKIQITAGLSNYDLKIGNEGEVNVRDIKWVKDSDGKYRVVVLDVE
ncbi:MAG: helix-turn-helix domain-containing protein [Treponema sp.]|nr:helix-turn-helix domain-containing protein [Treponema sp.]